MTQEIERKFLVCKPFKALVYSSSRIMQGYICAGSGRTVRIRIRDDKGYLTIKGATNSTGISRYEWEKEIPLKDAQELMQLCLPGIIDKTRYLVDYKGHTWEIDEFYGDNEGLMLAEIELEKEEETFDKPEFIGEEVTGDLRFYNSHLMQYPFKKWKMNGEVI